jgi:hydroxyacylglutathione hydrolase
MAIHTPGHCPGSTCYVYVFEDGTRYLFSGDTIFLNEANEWDVALQFHPYPGNKEDIIHSLQKLKQIPFNVLIPSIHTGTSCFDVLSHDEQRLRKVSCENSP